MVVKTVDDVVEITRGYKPGKKWYRHIVKRSAVAIILRQSADGLEALMIKRADRDGDPWSGHMAFPGGVCELGDRNNLYTAQRETLEEVGLNTEHYASCHARLSDILARRHRGKKPMIVTPYLFTINDVPELQLNHEVAEVFWIPLSFLADRRNRETMQWQIKKVDWTLPCYFYQQQRIWGLSLMMLDELMKLLEASAEFR